jgi:hypothetical protein
METPGSHTSTHAKECLLPEALAPPHDGWRILRLPIGAQDLALPTQDDVQLRTGAVSLDDRAPADAVGALDVLVIQLDDEVEQHRIALTRFLLLGHDALDPRLHEGSRSSSPLGISQGRHDPPHNAQQTLGGV